MTVFIASLFLPKTVLFDLPSETGFGRDANRSVDSIRDMQQRFFSLQPDPMSPENLHDKKKDTVIGDLASRGAPGSTNDADSSITISRPFKPGSRASISSPASTATWRVVNAGYCNGGLRNATDAAARDGKLPDKTGVGVLGSLTDGLDGTQQQQDIEGRLATEHDAVTVFCSDEDLEGHYWRFCKEILWPVLHYQMPDNPKSKAFEDHSWGNYVRVNQAFAEKIAKNWKRGDVIWVHDYHLMLLPSMLHRELPNAKIGFFLHVAFPSFEIFRCLAHRKELLAGMLGANLIGFQNREYSHNFLLTCSRLLNVEAKLTGVQLEDRFVNVTNLAIGIDPVVLSARRQDGDVRKWVDILKKRYQGKKMIFARDKMGYARGVRQNLLSYEIFLQRNPEWRDKTLLIQVALTAGEEKGEADATAAEIVTRVNSSWVNNIAHQPVVYISQDIEYSQYLALLTVADALIITNQREGMNLTSHDYVFCQDGRYDQEKKHGSLILSEFTGSSSIFGGYDLSVNPWDYSQCADAIRDALEMSSDEKERRWKKLYEAVTHYTASQWLGEFLLRLDRAYEEQYRRDQTSVPRLSIKALSQQYSQSGRRLFILDEGTLVRWGPVGQIIPVSPQWAVRVLSNLLLDERNAIYVASSRRQEEIDRLFERVPDLGLIAENGCFLKHHSNGANWTRLANPVQPWKEAVKRIMGYYLERTPGAKIEERECSLVFQYQMAEDQELAAKQAAECASHINEALEKQRVTAIPLDHSIVAELTDWNRRTAAENIVRAMEMKADPRLSSAAGVTSKSSQVDFLMVAGIGRDDEVVFEWANQLGEAGVVKNVVTVSLGNRDTEARATLTQGVSGLLTTLEKLTALS